MGPSRKSRSVNKQFANEVPPKKLAESPNKSGHKKRKLTNLLGPQWSKQELERFYHAYRKHGKNWKKVATTVRNRSAEMVEALYSMNKAYLSLPEGAASVVGLVAMMVDHYDQLGGSNSDRESSDDAVESRPKKRAKGNRSSKGSDEHFTHSRSQAQPVASSDIYLSLLNKKRSGSLPRVVRKRTPRVPFNFADKDKEKGSSPAKQRLKFVVDNDDVTHELAMALTSASQRSDSCKVSRVGNRKKESARRSPLQDAGWMSAGTQPSSSGRNYASFHDGSRQLSLRLEDGNMESFRGKSYTTGRKETVNDLQGKREKRDVKRREVENGADDYLDDLKEKNRTTIEKKASAVKRKTETETADGKKERKLPKGSQKKSSKSLFGDEDSAFDALQTLADMSLMMRSTTDATESRVEGKEETADAASRNKLKEKHGDSVVEESPAELPKPEISKAGDREFTSTVKKRKQKSPMKLQVYEKEAQADPLQTDNQKIESTEDAKSSTHKDQQSPQTSENLLEKSANALGFTYLGNKSKRKASALATQTELPSIEAKGGWKMDIQKPITTEVPSKEDTRLNKRLNHRPNLAVPLVNTREHNLKVRLSNCLSRRLARRWCTYEWFYGAIDYPWFARSEFVEYLQHVALDHIPRLTRVEWNVIKGSLGRPRRFSDNFLNEEREKLNQYRESVRKHYAELREGTREGLPTDLAQPMSVGQSIVAIHPVTRELQNGIVIAVEHDRYQIKFDLAGLGALHVMDFECRKLAESIPASLRRHSPKEQQPNKQLVEKKLIEQKLIEQKSIEQENDAPERVKPDKNLVNTETRSVPAPIEDIDDLLRCKEPPIETQIQTKEADIQAVSDLFRTLDKKEAVVLELRYMNDASENDKDSENPVKESEAFKKQHAAVLLQLNEVNSQVSLALFSLRERNRYQRISPPPIARPMSVLSCPLKDNESQVHEILESSRTKAKKVVDVALEAISTLENNGEDWETIEEAIDFVNDRLSEEDFESKPHGKISESNQKSDQTGPKVPSDLITHCVATLLMIQKCTERQFPPSEVARVLDSAVTDLMPFCPENLSVYEDIQKYMGIIRTQILALVPS